MPKENFTEELKKVLISEIEVSEERASEILEKTKLSAIKPEELRERLKFLKNEIGYTNNEISKVVDKFDRVLSYNVQKMSSALKEFSDCFPFLNALRPPSKDADHDEAPFFPVGKPPVNR